MLNVRFCHFLAGAVLFFAGTALGQGYKVVGVSDGDTFAVLDVAASARA